MSRVAWFNVEHGAAGDMMLASLLDAGASLERLQSDLSYFGIGDGGIDREYSKRAGLRATSLRLAEPEQQARTWKSIDYLLSEAPWPERARERSRAVFARLAAVEAGIHNVAVDDVHFHEVGALDSIIDIAGTVLALEYLDIDELWYSKLGVSSGRTDTAHGSLPAFAPATAVLVTNATIVVHDWGREILTPTAAALLTTLGTQHPHVRSLRVERSGMGAGTWNPESHPNVVQVVLGAELLDDDEPVIVLETVVDDLTGEHIGHVLSSLLDAGALDAWASPVSMKKGRPGHEITVLSQPHAIDEMTTTLLDLTGSLGVRRSLQTRSVRQRSFTTIEVFGHPVQLKLGPARVKPEFEDLATVSRATGHTLYEVEAEALTVWRDQTSRSRVPAKRPARASAEEA